MTVASLFGALEGPELFIILAIVLLLFGGAKLPQLARSLGQAKKEFMTAQGEETTTPAAPPQPQALPASVEDVVSVPKAELDRLRALAEQRSTEA